MDDDEGGHIVQELNAASLKANLRGLGPTRNPSFFRKIFSQSGKSGTGGFGDDDSSEASSAIADLHGRDDAEEKEEFLALRRKVGASRYIDPPMPHLGYPVRADLLLDRNQKAEKGMETLMNMVRKEVNIASSEAKYIPVSNELDRITVTEDMSAMISKVRRRRDIDDRVQENMNEIQKALNFRKSAIIMMNSNYSKKQVRKIEPIYVREARTIIEHHSEDKD